MVIAHGLLGQTATAVDLHAERINADGANETCSVPSPPRVPRACPNSSAVRSSHILGRVS